MFTSVLFQFGVIDADHITLLFQCAAFQVGKLVTIRSGPFQGLEGVVQLVRGKTKVVLNVEMIGRALAVEVPVELLDPVE